MNKIGRKRSASGGVLPGGEALPRGAVKWGEGLFACVPRGSGLIPTHKLHAGDCECPECCAQWRKVAEGLYAEGQRAYVDGMCIGLEKAADECRDRAILNDAVEGELDHATDDNGRCLHAAGHRAIEARECEAVIRSLYEPERCAPPLDRTPTTDARFRQTQDFFDNRFKDQESRTRKNRFGKDS